MPPPQRITAAQLVAVFVFGTAPATITAAEPAKPSNAAARAALKGETGGGRRALNLDEIPSNTVPAIRVGKAITTTLMFGIPIRAVDLLDPGKLFAPLPANPASRSLYLTPTRDPGSTVATLVVGLTNGMEVPFQVIGARNPKDVDIVVDIVSSNGRGGTMASVGAACCTSAAQLRQELDECQASSKTDALRKIATLILAQDSSAAQSAVFEGREVRKLDKDAGLLVQAQAVYRLFDYSYLVLSVENRVADRPWVLYQPVIRSAGGELPIISFHTELAVLPPSETEKIVIVFATPSKRTRSSISLELKEKGGTRNVTLESIAL